ncbi:hypothetical protein E2C01_099542 [Portunus trituberculatus]|uniref:Uncharacterized protein n=1 Tax=Portunus trituberculatus TaxID=210409 RepID=A0A5B7KB13_PORTR|nr:hypothetical protein [Portunus trituberculatus]
MVKQTCGIRWAAPGPSASYGPYSRGQKLVGRLRREVFGESRKGLACTGRRAAAVHRPKR